MDLSSAQTSTVFNFATQQGKTIVYLHLFDLAICLVIALTVAGLLTFVAIKFRYRSGDEEPKQSRGNVKLEIAWTVIPTLIVFTLGILTALVMNVVNPPLGSRQPDVVVNAHQWWWEYRYPKSGVVTANELYLPQGVDSVLEIRSDDVVHSFWVPDFGEKMDAIPGHPNHLFLKPIREGLFIGSCSEYCGADHSLMRILARVVSQKEFDAWTQRQLKVPPAPVDRTAQQGAQLFLSKSCVQCHSIAGTSAAGRVGPDLTHVADRQTLGTGLLPNDTDNLARWISDPQKFKPGCHMPRMRLSEKDAHDIAVYLESLK
ncbi:MAG: cytochrome c oxidase subunit II [Terriglobales bacterium]